MSLLSQSSEPAGLLEVLQTDGVLPDGAASLTALTGGVSSEIYLVRSCDRQFVVKRALPKLKVAEEWLCDVSRNIYEQRYLSYVGGILPRAVPRILFSNPDQGYFGMEYLGGGFANWKTLLLEGRSSAAHALEAASILGSIHKASLGNAGMASKFDSTTNFHQLRTDPYLITTGRRYPELRDIFEKEARRLESTRECLVHGDFSPKNILVSSDRMVVLDCEVAWYGDPVFDAAFLLNHLLLKSLHHAPRGSHLREFFDLAWSGYAATREFSPSQADSFSRKTARLLLMLLLARVDGKSPAEYLDTDRKNFVRRFVTTRLRDFHEDLAFLGDAWFAGLSRQFPNS